MLFISSLGSDTVEISRSKKWLFEPFFRFDDEEVEDEEEDPPPKPVGVRPEAEGGWQKSESKEIKRLLKKSWSTRIPCQGAQQKPRESTSQANSQKGGNMDSFHHTKTHRNNNTSQQSIRKTDKKGKDVHPRPQEKHGLGPCVWPQSSVRKRRGGMTNPVTELYHVIHGGSQSMPSIVNGCDAVEKHLAKNTRQEL